MKNTGIVFVLRAHLTFYINYPHLFDITVKIKLSRVSGKYEKLNISL